MLPCPLSPPSTRANTHICTRKHKYAHTHTHTHTRTHMRACTRLPSVSIAVGSLTLKHHTLGCIADFISAEAVSKSLRLVITFGSLTRSQFLNALEERLGPPLKRVCCSYEIGSLSLLNACYLNKNDLQVPQNSYAAIPDVTGRGAQYS